MVRQRPAKPCTRVRFPSPPPKDLPRAISSAGERFPDTEEVTGSIPVSRTILTSSYMVRNWLACQIHAKWHLFKSSVRRYREVAP